MEPFEKLEIILQGMMADNKKEIERTMACGANPSYPYIQGLRDVLAGVEKVYATILDIKNGGYAVSDEVIETLWKPKVES